MNVGLTMPSLGRTGVLPTLTRVAEAVGLAQRQETDKTVRLSRPMKTPFGAFNFRVQVPHNSRYAVEACTDLKSWDAVGSGTSSGNTLEYVDSQAHRFSYRFYRVRVGESMSENVIGYASVSLPPKYSMIANPFVSSQTVSELFPKWPNGTTLNRFDTARFGLAENRVLKDRWADPRSRLLPGEGALFFNPTTDYKAVTFSGEIPNGIQTASIPAGFCIRSSPLPVPGSLDELGFPVADGDVIHVFDRDQQKYLLHPFENGAWKNGPVVLGIGESFWVAKSKPATWTIRTDLFKSAPAVVPGPAALVSP